MKQIEISLVLLCLVGMACCLIQITTQSFDVFAHVLFVSLSLVGTFSLRSLSKIEKR